MLAIPTAALAQQLDDETATQKWFEAAAFVAKNATHDADAKVTFRGDVLNEFINWVSQPEQAAFRNADFSNGNKKSVDVFTLAQDAYLGGQGRYESNRDVIVAIDEQKPYELPQGYKSAQQLKTAQLASIEFAKLFLTDIVFFARPVIRARVEDGTINAIKSFLEALASPKP